MKFDFVSIQFHAGYAGPVPNRRNNADAGKPSPNARSISELRARAAKLTARTQKLSRDMANLAAAFTDEKTLRVKRDDRRHVRGAGEA
jgi:hypothetical protein